jgi:hypothetical protein
MGRDGKYYIHKTLAFMTLYDTLSYLFLGSERTKYPWQIATSTMQRWIQEN